MGTLPGSQKEYEAYSNEEGMSVMIDGDEKITGDKKWYAVIYDEVLRDVFAVVYSDEDGRLTHM